MPNVIQIRDKEGNALYPITDSSLVIGLKDGGIMENVMAWDGTSAPTVANIPAGVQVEYNSTTYTGTLAASGTTSGYIYLVASATQQGEYDRYIVNAAGGSYTWVALSSTQIVSPTIADNLTTNDATKALSAKQGKVLNDELSQLGQETNIKFGLPKYAVQPGGFVDGWYWYNNSGVVAKLTNNATYCGCAAGIPVVEGDNLFFSIAASSGGFAIVLADSANNVVSLYNGANLANLGGRLTIPSGVSLVYINTYKAEKETSYCIVIGVFLKGMLDESTRVADNIETKSFTAVNGAGVNADYIFEVGKQYRITNEGPKHASVYTTEGATNIETIMFSAAAATTVLFTPSTKASKIRIVGSEGGNAVVKVETGIDKRVTDIENSYAETKEVVDKAMLVDGEMKVTPGAGGILQDGTFDSNATFDHFVVPLSDKVIKTFTFQKSYVNNSTRNAYGFIVNGQWQGFSGNATAKAAVEDITVDVPVGATEFRVCWNRNQVSDAVFHLLFNGYIHGITDKPRNDMIFQFVPDFILSRVPNTIVCPMEQEASDLTLSQLYAKWDGLVTLYPEYITKVDCDAEAQAALSITAPAYMSGLPIYLYKFSPKIGGNSTGEDKTSRVKILLTSMHPQERLGMYTMFETMKMVCDNWKNDVNAEQLRSLVDFYVLPCPWPWNFENRSRANYNGVNGNRQFPTKNWTESGQGTADWSGSAPLSEYEAKVVNYFLLKIAPNVSVDVHTSGNDNMGHMGIFLVNQDDQPLVDLCGVIARTTSNRAIQDNTNFPSSPDTCIYGVYPEDGSAKGEFYEYAYEKGCRCSVLSEESPYSKWSNGVFGGTSGPEIESYTDGILREQVQYLFNTLLRLTRQACVLFYN